MNNTTNTILNVAIPSPLRRCFDYLPPHGVDASDLQAGIRIKVPFGKQTLIGLLLSTSDHSSIDISKLKPAIEILDQQPLLPPHLLTFCRWAASYYQHPIGDALSNALPVLLRKGEAAQGKTDTLWQLTSSGKNTDPESLTRAPKQAEVMRLLLQHPQGMSNQALKTLKLTGSPLKMLQEKSFIVSSQQEQSLPRFDHTNILKETELALNNEQQTAVTAINKHNKQFQSFLLAGVTGSGKTEVYLQAIAHVLAQGQQALVLVPEIGLTPQTVARFQQRFNCPIAIMHSGLNDRERLQAWLQASRGAAGIVIGTRSAIFTPLANPGIIIIDEEHDVSFKQQEGFRYSARDLAIVRAQAENTPVVLGTATPSLESLHNCKQQRYQLLILNERAGEAVIPQFQLLDIRGLPLQDGFSQPLIHAIQDHLNAGNQVLIFLNRRGYAPTLMCHDCGWLAECKRCDARMTLHRSPAHLHCHHCDSQKPIPRQCPDCQSHEIHPVGLGTERSEEYLTQLFPNYPVIRIDRDSTRRKHAMAEILAEINKGQAGILVGTQMIAKGHHFPDVTLVAVLDADSGLFSADFRGLERMGQLLLQVAGRAGRASKPGTVMVQTHHAEHPTVSTLIHQGYHAFAETTLSERKNANLPPYTSMVLIRAEATQQQEPYHFLQTAAQMAEQLASQQAAQTNSQQVVSILGPIPSPMEKRAGRFRSQLLFQSPSRKALQQLLSQLTLQLESLKESRRVRWSIDVDPQDMF